ncbi:MAG: acyltransferase domain-containing protein, partial [bacterium]|nr:acyltransferase domain-containing protein [bacterium]
MTPANQTPIAIIGISSIFPDSPKVADFWQHICAGTDLFTDVPNSHWLKEDYCNPDYRLAVPHARGGFLPEMDFDPVAFKIPPNLLKSTDTVQLLALLAVKELIDGLTCLQNGQVSLEDVSCILGVAGGTELLGQMSAKIQRGNWLYALRKAEIPEPVAQKICDRIEDTFAEWTENTFPGLLTNVVSGRIANRFDLGGTNCTLDAACASSLAAITMAIQELQLGNCRLAISGGADALNDPSMYVCFTHTHAMSAGGDCRPFDKSGDGTVLGEGIGLVALKRLDDAEADGDSIYAVIKGYGSSSDGRSKSVYAPRSGGQARAIRRAYQKADYDLDTVELIEAHGTATPAGDIAEYEGLKLAFQESGRKDKQWCALGSVKSQIGHTKSTAGAASLIKTALALHHKILPPTIKVTEPNPKLDFTNGPLYLNTETRPWISNGKHPRRAGLSSLGFGGTNFHLTLEEYTGPSAKPPHMPQDTTSLLLFSSDSTSNLKLALANIRKLLEKRSLIAVAKYSQQNFRAGADQRLAIVASDKNKAADLINRAEQRLSDDDPAWNIPGSIYFSSQKREGKLAFLFPGQGSQYLNMGRELLNAFPQAHQAWQEANASLEESLQATVFPIPAFTKEDRAQQAIPLNQTEWAQPALGATCLAFLTLLNEVGLKPDAVAGLSYGELVALHAAGVVSSPEALMQTSAIRGALMAKHAATDEAAGTMTAVFAPYKTMETLLNEAEKPLVIIANDNSPKQVVIGGPVDDMIETEKLLEARGVKYKRLPVSAAFHTPQFAGADKDFADFLDKNEWHKAQIPVYSNKTSEVYPEDTAAHKGLFAYQMASPVRFREMVKTMVEDGVTTFVEVGAGNTLTNLTRDCLSGEQVHALAMDHKKRSSHDTFWNVLGQLSVIGYELNFANLWQPFAVEDPTQPHPKLSTAAIKIN